MATKFRNLVEKKEEKKKPIEFTHSYRNGWILTPDSPIDFDNVDYLGRYKWGDLFLVWDDSRDVPLLFKGYLNDGFIADEN